MYRGQSIQIKKIEPKTYGNPFPESSYGQPAIASLFLEEFPPNEVFGVRMNPTLTGLFTKENFPTTLSTSNFSIDILFQSKETFISVWYVPLILIALGSNDSSIGRVPRGSDV